MSIDINDFDKICRICLKDIKPLQLISTKIIEMIQACAPVKISFNDELPTHICQDCVTRLQDSFDFKELCESSDSNLRKIIKKHKSSNEDENPIPGDVSVKSEVIDFEEANIKELKCKEEVDDNNSNAGAKELSYTKTDEGDEFFKDEVIDSNFECEVDKSKSIKTNTKKKSLKVEKPYACEECNENFVKTWSLAVHMRRVHNFKGIKCDKCSKICFHKLHLLDHQKIHYGTEFVCDICQKYFTDQTKLDRHKSAHVTERTYYCFQCDKSFKDKWALRQHVRKIHLHTAEKRVSCEICGKKVSVEHIKRHKLIHQQRETIPCNQCPKQFTHPKSLQLHIEREHEKIGRKYNHLCDVCGRSVESQKDLRRHLLTHTGEKPYACDKCDKKYRTTYMLKTHISRAHLNQRNHICSHCSRGFFDRVQLENHIRTHTGERPFACVTCNKSYKTKSRLRSHMSIIHLNKLNYPCEICTRRFNNRSSLTSHLKVHSEQKSYKLVTCDICGKEVQKGSLTRHRETHSDIPKFICELCDKKFATKYSYQNHINVVHEKNYKRNFKCNICGKMFRKSWGLKQHLITHTQEKPYACDRCDKKFASKTSLKNHIARTHLDEGKFSCSVCTQSFFDSTTAENHIRTHTGEKPFQCKDL